jgi:anti-anti-sigma factor
MDCRGMGCRAQAIADVILVRVAGRIDHTTAKAFENTLLPLLDGYSGEAKRVLLDLSGVAYMSSAGLRVLILAAKQCREPYGEIVVAALQPPLQEVFGIARLELVFKVFKTVREGLEAISPAAAVAYDHPA